MINLGRPEVWENRIVFRTSNLRNKYMPRPNYNVSSNYRGDLRVKILSNH